MVIPEQLGDKKRKPSSSRRSVCKKIIRQQDLTARLRAKIQRAKGLNYMGFFFSNVKQMAGPKMILPLGVSCHSECYNKPCNNSQDLGCHPYRYSTRGSPDHRATSVTGWCAANDCTDRRAYHRSLFS